MPVAASPARFGAPALALAVGLAASRAGADPLPVTTGAPLPSPGSWPTPLRAPAEPVTVDVGARLGVGFRIGDGSPFSVTGGTGVALAAGVAIAPSSRYALGLAYEHSALGTEHGQGDLGVVDLGRNLDAVWASVRLTLFRADPFMVAVTIGPGIVWQTVDASVIVLDPDFGPTTAFRCTTTAGAALGLRAGVGAEVHLGGGFFADLDGVIDELRLSSDPIGACAPGAGSTAIAGVRGGFTYRFDVSRYVR